MQLGDWLKSRRMKTKDFAKRIKRHRATVARWLDPKSNIRPTWRTIVKIEDLTGGEVTAEDWARPKLQNSGEVLEVGDASTELQVAR